MSEKQLGHMVFFKLKDASADKAHALVKDCDKYLKPHAGIVYFSAGTLAKDLNRDVNDLNFDVALHLVFETKKHHDEYQETKSHHEFIDKNKENWANVRVFDSYI